ncbi:hypothetical protein CR194_02380 [Salipaludibacillus keqinensis]|uniref:Divergent polysaccharide deacetylase family protein n=2 Tax=Salipaludibacillus keqinensis TaxID=2045207 RepID=A0A323U0F8_9BACI|nr:hypothetical protein CR194_02380 [Salipaludibacillus keqinensis]
MENTESKAAIIIDDFGGIGKGTDEFLKGSLPITVAIMPFMENSTAIAEEAHEQGFEIMIHMPMEPKKGKRSWLGPQPITSDLSLEEVRFRVEQAIENVPHAKGLNQHMGSKIVENKSMIYTILKVAKEHDLYVIDSGTNPASCIGTLAEKMKIPYAERHLFLDDTHSSQDYVYNMTRRLVDLADENGQAIGIGHVGIKGVETYKAIERAEAYFREKDVELVPASYLLETDIDQDPVHFWEQIE